MALMTLTTMLSPTLHALQWVTGTPVSLTTGERHALAWRVCRRAHHVAAERIQSFRFGENVTVKAVVDCRVHTPFRGTSLTIHLVNATPEEARDVLQYLASLPKAGALTVREDMVGFVNAVRAEMQSPVFAVLCGSATQTYLLRIRRDCEGGTCHLALEAIEPVARDEE